MKKRNLSLILAFIFISCFVLSACGSNTSTSGSEEVYYADEDFISALSKALEGRWAINEKYEPEEEPNTIYPDHWKEGVEKEISVLGEYEDAKFQDSKLKEYAISYINCLKQQIEAISYVNADYETFDKMWTEAYDNRTKLISTFVNSYGLSVAETYQSTLNDMISNAKVVEKQEAAKAQVSELEKSIQFELTENSYGYKTYQAVVENTTDTDFKYFSVSINLIDSDGVIIESNYANVDNWKSGQKARFEFTTDQDFASLETTVDYYDAN